MATRVDDVRAAGEDGDGKTVAVEAATMRGGVDAECQAAHHGHVSRAETAPEGVGDLDAVRTRVARTDDGDGRVLL